MITFIALLRGINVGGHKKFPKAEQLEMLTALGFNNPQVYIHTGNWVFESSENAASLSLKISEAIIKKYGWEVPVIVLPSEQLLSIFENSPFTGEKKEQSYFTMLAETPTLENSTIFNSFSFPEEEIILGDCCVYSFSTISAARVKMNTNFIEKKLKVSATSRNYKTMSKLIALSSS
jgi:uncharacterized protein (DUF1697 family)